MKIMALFGLLCILIPQPGLSQEIWYTPNNGSEDMIRLFQQPEEWENARKQIAVFGFYNIQVDGTPEGLYSLTGPNVLKNFLEKSTVPGGPFRWLNDQGIKINIESGAVKLWSCDDIMKAVRLTMLALDNITANGGTVSYITIDESFASGLPKQWEWALDACNFTEEQTAEQIKLFVEAIHAKYPDIQIGFWEPYPYFNMEQVKRFLLLMKNKEIPVPFFSLDFNHLYALQLGLDVRNEIRDLQQFCRNNNISLGLNIIGDNGTSNETYAFGLAPTPDACGNMRTPAIGAISLATELKAIAGMPDRLIFESWVDHPPSCPVDRRLYPENLPEWNPISHTGLILSLTEYFRIR